MADSVKSAFDLTAREYDRARRQLVPCFDDFYRTAIDLLPFDRDAQIDVLDLGAGTGLLAALIADVYTGARITLVDVAPEMLARARDRFAADPDRVRFAVSDYSHAPIGGRYDAIVSALLIHHLADADKRGLFARIHAALNQGGIFINAEQVMGSTPQAERRNRTTWLRQVRERGVTEGDLAAALERMKHDRMAPLEVQLRWLSEAGFRDVDCAYKSWMFAVYCGSK
jgi:tRNA (cmo5U34)-methyltransferase